MNVVQRRLDRLGVICDCFVRLYLCHAPPATMAGWQELRWEAWKFVCAVVSFSTATVTFNVVAAVAVSATSVVADAFSLLAT